MLSYACGSGSVYRLLVDMFQVRVDLRPCRCFRNKGASGRISWRNRLPGHRLTVKLQTMLRIELTF